MKLIRTIMIAIIALFGATTVISCSGETPDEAGETMTVFAAASLTDVLTDLAREFEAETGHTVRLNIAGTSALTRQIEAGAAFDIFLAANTEWVEYLIDREFIRPEDVRSMLRNRLVLVVAADDRRWNDVEPDSAPPAFERLAIGDPDHVPAGMYAREALEAMNWWDEMRAQVVPTADVRAALRLLELGEVDAAIVYATDIHTSARVQVLIEISEETHATIEYPMALAPNASAAGRDFARFLTSANAERRFTDDGFTFTQ